MAQAGRRATLVRLSALSLAPWLAAAANAQAPGAARAALVVGNSRYAELPALRNPSNDAAALGRRLGEIGFAVRSHLDVGKEAFDAAIRAHCEQLARDRGVGLFYFAGHGLQVRWRNYLVPVDARLAGVEDVPRRAVDLNDLLEGIRRAGNPMNIVILDACRDNPFALDLRSGNGLSQIDAPVGTLLAYATAPGNTASDGEGVNGLYTEQLLKEMAAPRTKIEDVFKRVRLNVRRASRGRQIPGESTSREVDFYLSPPQVPSRPSRAELDRRFAEEAAAWQKADAQATIASIEDYLRRYPSGNFAEIAQGRLDRLLALAGERKAAPISPASNPYSKGTVRPDPDFRVGDWYEFRVKDLYTGVELPKVREEVVKVKDFRVEYSTGKVTDLLSNNIVGDQGDRVTDNQTYPAEFSVGRKWVTRYRQDFRSGGFDETEIVWVIAAREGIEVPAGRFEAFRLEGSGYRVLQGGRRRFTMWLAPDRVRRALVREQWRWDGKGAPGRSQRIELAAFREARSPSEKA